MLLDKIPFRSKPIR